MLLLRYNSWKFKLQKVINSKYIILETSGIAYHMHMSTVISNRAKIEVRYIQPEFKCFC